MRHRLLVVEHVRDYASEHAVLHALDVQAVLDVRLVAAAIVIHRVLTDAEADAKLHVAVVLADAVLDAHRVAKAVLGAGLIALVIVGAAQVAVLRVLTVAMAHAVPLAKVAAVNAQTLVLPGAKDVLDIVAADVLEPAMDVLDACPALDAVAIVRIAMDALDVLAARKHAAVVLGAVAHAADAQDALVAITAAQVDAVAGVLDVQPHVAQHAIQ